MNDESVKATESQTSPEAVREKPESAEGHVHAPSRRMFVAGALSVASLFALGGAGQGARGAAGAHASPGCPRRGASLGRMHQMRSLPKRVPRRRDRCGPP